MSKDSIALNAIAVNDVFKFILKAKGAMQDVTKMVLIRIGERLHYYSVIGDPKRWHPPYWPKGYIPGQFINNWQLGCDVVPGGWIAVSDPSGAASKMRMRKSIPRWPMGHTYYFVNNVPYARLLETGLHSAMVPPGGMVQRTRMEFNQIVRQCEMEYINRGK